jgi:SNF2 family DNA or RNA helicase
MRKQGNNIEIEDVPAPRPTRRRTIKAQASDDSDESDSSIDPDASEPEAQFVSAKDRAKEIGKAAVGGGLTNRRTGSQQADLKEAKLTFGRDKVQALDQGGEMRYQLQGMTVMLRPFQLVGTSWMVKRETDDGDHKGGLLADVPGFGKTVMSLGAIVGNPPSPEQISQGIKATLVVVPNVSILKQWEAEIEKHLEHANVKYLHYKSAMKKLDLDVFNNTNIV